MIDNRYYCIKDFVSKEYQNIMYRKGEYYCKLDRGEQNQYDATESLSVTICLNTTFDNANIIGFCFVKRIDSNLFKEKITNYEILEDYFLSPVEYRKFKIRNILNETD